jgi:SAM-dependent methyltransferase
MLPIRSDIKIYEDEGIRCFFNDSVITDSDKKEFIANNNYEKRISQHHEGTLLFEDIVFKSDFIRTFEVLIPKLDLSGKEVILEMGAAHGWASTWLKNRYPNSYVVISDLVPDTVKHSKKYGNLLGVQADEKWAFNCRDIPFKEKTFDRIFTFASFHHFGEAGDYSKSLEQMIRILKPGGKIILLYEPSSPKYLYNLAFKRVNKRRDIDGVDEDVLIPSNLEEIAKEHNCSCKIEFFPFYLYRPSISSAIYYFLLSKLWIFQRFLVNGINVVIEKTDE